MIDIPTTITTAAQTYTPPSGSIVLPSKTYFGQRGEYEPVPLVQYDDTLPIIAAALYLNGQPYTVPDGAAVNIRMAKGDGTYVYNPALGVSEDRQTAYIAVTYQMTVIAGNYCPILELVVSGDVAGTSELPLQIAENPVPEDAIASTDEYKTIQQLAAEVNQAAQIVTDNLPGIQYIQQNADTITAVAQNSENITAVGGSIGNVNSVAQNLTPIQTAATNISAIQAAPTAASNAAASATLAESWAVGGTGSRPGEDTNNAKFWAQQAESFSNGSLGYFATPQALQSAHPTGQNGQWAIIGSTDSIWVWDSDTSAWVSSVNLSDYYTKEQTNGIVGWLYKAIFDVDSWTGSGSVSQTATLVPVDGGPPVTSGSTLLACIGTDSTVPQETKDAMAGPAADIAGAEKNLGTGTISVTLDSAPNVDVELYFYIKQGVSPAVPPLDPVGAGGNGMELLWENDSPTIPFSAQTITVDKIKNFNFIVLLFIRSAQYTDLLPPIVCTSAFPEAKASYFSPGNTGAIRDISVDFASGKVTFGAASTTNYVQPVLIYGVKM